MHKIKTFLFLLVTFLILGAHTSSYGASNDTLANGNEKQLTEQTFSMNTLVPKILAESAKDKVAANETIPTIGILLPLSGKWSSVGQQLLRGIQLASNVFGDGKTPRICYVIEDYGDNEAKIPSLIKDIDEKNHVLAIIGPVGESASKLACDAAQKRGIPTIVFTQADLPPVENSYCFSNFISTNNQAKTLLKTAKGMGIKKFAILYPKDHFGTIFASSFKSMAKSYGITVVREANYSPGKIDFKDEVKKLFTREKTPGGELWPWFDALLIPDTGINAAMVASYLSYYEVQDVRLFGPTLWNTKEFITIGGKNVEDAIFVSGFYEESWDEALRDFMRLFSYAFGYSPSIWEASAYDTATIIQDLSSEGAISRSTLKEKLSGLRDYPGVTGSTSFFPNGSVEKVLFVLTIKDSRVIEFISD